MNRRQFIVGATAAVVSTSVVGAVFEGVFKLDDAKLKWYETTFDYGTLKGLGVTYQASDGRKIRTAIRYRKPTDRAYAKRQLIKWIEEVV